MNLTIPMSTKFSPLLTLYLTIVIVVVAIAAEDLLALPKDY